MRSLVVLTILVLAGKVVGDCSSPGDTTVYPTHYTTSHSGEATYYGVYTNGGACSLDPTPPAGSSSAIFSTVAIADNIWAGSKACGLCINMTASGSGSGASPLRGSYIVFVNNECPSCTNNGIDVGLSGDGVWDISWKAVPCPISSNIQFKFQGSHNYYIKLQVRNTRYPVYKVALLQSGVYVDLVRTADNFFTAGSGVTFPVNPPLSVKITASTGDFVLDSVPYITNDVVINGATQFLDCSSGSTGSSSTTAKAATTTTTTAKPATTTTTTAKPATTTTTTGKSATTTTTTGKTATTGASTTGSPSSTYVFKDAVLAPYSDWSWPTPLASCNTSVKSEGTCSYSFSPSNWQAAYFHTTVPFSSSATIQFDYYTSNTQVLVNFAPTANGAGLKSVPVTASSPNVWTSVLIRLTQEPSWGPGPFDGFWLQDGSGKSQPQVNMDAIRQTGA